VLSICLRILLSRYSRYSLSILSLDTLSLAQKQDPKYGDPVATTALGGEENPHPLPVPEVEAVSALASEMSPASEDGADLESSVVFESEAKLTEIVKREETTAGEQASGMCGALDGRTH
jgi:hypothetical protein